MCVTGNGHPSCPCPCTFIQQTDLFLTLLVFRGIPITRMSCKKRGHQQGQRVGYKVRLGSKPGT